MAAIQCIGQLGAWEGYEVEAVEQVCGGSSPSCVIRLRRFPGSGCDGTAAVHDIADRHVRDLPMFGIPVELLVPRARLRCPRCGPKLEQLSWLQPYARVTTRLAWSVSALCKVMSVRHVAAFYGLAWSAVKHIDSQILDHVLGPIKLDDVRVIAMDEFAIQKGHRYATVVVEPYRKQVLWVGRGRGRADVRPFFELWPASTILADGGGRSCR